MNGRELLDEAIILSPEEKVFLVEGLLRSLDEPDPRLDAIWLEESERRLKACREGRLALIPFDEVFQD